MSQASRTTRVTIGAIDSGRGFFLCSMRLCSMRLDRGRAHQEERNRRVHHKTDLKGDLSRKRSILCSRINVPSRTQKLLMAADMST